MKNGRIDKNGLINGRMKKNWMEENERKKRRSEARKSRKEARVVDKETELPMSRLEPDRFFRHLSSLFKRDEAIHFLYLSCVYGIFPFLQIRGKQSIDIQIRRCLSRLNLCYNVAQYRSPRPSKGSYEMVYTIE